MSELLGKLTNLNYEFFGVLLPGVATSTLIVLAWIVLGDVVPTISFQVVPKLTPDVFVAWVKGIGKDNWLFYVVPLLACWYFLGHSVLWVSRSRTHEYSDEPSAIARVLRALVFQTCRPAHSFEPKLKALFEEVKKKFEKDDLKFDWRQFYPVAKNYLAQHVTYSLVATYQHKYTLHRSLVCTAALFFWLLAAGGMFSFILQPNVPQPLWGWLLICIGGALVLVWGFSGSFIANWLMFGNTIITECYSLLCGPTRLSASPALTRDESEK